MADYRSDDEQLELVQRWWKENGTSLLITIAVVVAGVFGWRAWQDSRAADQAEAAGLYASLVEALAADTAETRETANYVADQLRAEHSGSGYTLLASLHLAKKAMDDGNPLAAETELRRVVDADESDSLTALARLRLARVYFQQDRLDDALAELTQIDDVGLAVERGELEGDVRLANGETAAARSAYEAALAAAGSPDARPFLQQKLDDVR